MTPAADAPPLSVLVVDDSRVMRAMIIRTLRLCGLPLGTVHEAADGLAGLGILEAEPITLALVDINMPKLSGLDMLARLGRPASGPVVIVVSSDGSDARAAQVLAMGHGFLHKPFAPEDLRDAVLRALGIPDDDR
ncbi:MAG TPA: response regulator [Gemmatimonadaceae bacterium]|nr:response regulator [Gemmatimonadaceae bacterium]